MVRHTVSAMWSSAALMRLAVDGPPALCRGGVVHYIGYGAGCGGRHSDAGHGGRYFACEVHNS